MSSPKKTYEPREVMYRKPQDFDYRGARERSTRLYLLQALQMMDRDMTAILRAVPKSAETCPSKLNRVLTKVQKCRKLMQEVAGSLT